MPQDKFISRQQADLHELNPKYRMPSDTFTKKSLQSAIDTYKEEMAKGTPKKAAARASVDARALTASKAVTARDATNTRIARERLASRASSAKVQPRGGGMMAKAAALGPVAEGAAAMYAADEATGFRRTKYSGPSGGSSFSMNPYASSNKSAYNGQSNMSKMMGVGKKK